MKRPLAAALAELGLEGTRIIIVITRKVTDALWSIKDAFGKKEHLNRTKKMSLALTETLHMTAYPADTQR